MKHWIYVIDHWQDITTVFLSVARPSFPWKDLLILLLVPAFSIYGSIRMTERDNANQEQQISIIRARVETNTRIIEADHAMLQLVVGRMDQQERRHDEIMSLILSFAKAGSGYTSLPGDHHDR